MHGTSALYEAVKNGHQETMEVLMANGADLCMGESTAASVLCQTVFDGDTVLLKRLVRAGIDINAGDYDKRSAVHISAAEGNLVALKVQSLRGHRHRQALHATQSSPTSVWKERFQLSL